MTQKRDLNILLASPRGFCAGVDRAVKIVELALEKYGAPVYVRHEIVHNKFVVETLANKGAVFVEELDQVPDGAPVIFSAHGVPKKVPLEAQNRNMVYVDATCPLVSKVHREAEIHFEAGHHVILIGHAGHPEVIGTMGQLPEGAITLIETISDVEKLEFTDSSKLSFITQTTLSVDDTKEIIKALQDKFPGITAPKKEDICYATTNRQQAVKVIAEKVDALLVLGAPNSSNSKRLVEVAKAYGCTKAQLIQRAVELDYAWFDGVNTVGLTAGASAPDILIQEVIDALKERFNVSLEEIVTAEENVEFKVPRVLCN